MLYSLRKLFETATAPILPPVTTVTTPPPTSGVEQIVETQRHVTEGIANQARMTRLRGLGLDEIDGFIRRGRASIGDGEVTVLFNRTVAMKECIRCSPLDYAWLTINDGKDSFQCLYQLRIRPDGSVVQYFPHLPHPIPKDQEEATHKKAAQILDQVIASIEWMVAS